MKVLIYDRNLAVVEYISQVLKKIENVEVIQTKTLNEFTNFIEKNDKNIDFIFIEDKFYKEILEISNNPFLIILTFDISIEINISHRVFYKLRKDITEIEFKSKFNILSQLREYVKNEELEKLTLKEVLAYKDQHEEIAIQKQLKLISNELSMFYENDYMIESYFNPKELLSGDAILTKRIDENKYFFTVIDAMGKGISASLTSINSVGFLYYSITKGIEHNNFNIKRHMEDLVNYTKSILIENEALCLVAGYVDGNTLYYANFGMPPIYIDRKKFKPNNMPIHETTENSSVVVSEVKFEKDILMFSDGLIEPFTKDNRLYLSRFKEILPYFTFLKDLTKDFEKNAIQGDDTTIFYLKKEKFKMEKIFHTEIQINKTNIDKFLIEFDNNSFLFKDKILFLLQELLLNSYEHSHLLLQAKKDKYLRNNSNLPEKIEENIVANVEIYENDRFVKLNFWDNGEGFDIAILKTLGRNKLHGRGIKMMKSIADAVFYNKQRNGVNIYFKKKESFEQK